MYNLCIKDLKNKTKNGEYFKSEKVCNDQLINMYIFM